jgi:peptidoglycan DL-endopeptidase LytE
VVPRAPATLMATNSRPAAPTEVASRAISGSAALPATDSSDTSSRQRDKVEPAKRVADASTRTVLYRVKRGDTLFTIARLFDTTVDRIKSLNRLSSNRITVGTKLKVTAAP